MFKKTFLVIIVFSFLGFAFFANAQFLYSDSVDHYSFELPNGWKEIPANVIELFIAEITKQTQGQPIEYDAGFQLADREYFQYPYILVQEYKINTPSYDEVQKMLDGGSLNKEFKRAAEEYSELLQSSSINSPFIDKERGIIFMSFDINVVDFGAIKGLAAVILGKQHTTTSLFFMP